MLERWITALHTEDPGLEEPAATRERFKDAFPRGATRRMTQPGLLLGSVLAPLTPSLDDTLVYATAFAETRALESYLDSFPAPSPTLFQTSIHPSAAQQLLIARQQPVRHFFPMTGGAFLPARALEVALLAETPRVILCGGEERGTWLLESATASDRAFAFALALSDSPANALGRIALGHESTSAPNSAAERLPLPAFFDLLHQRRRLEAFIAPSVRLTLTWS